MNTRRGRRMDAREALGLSGRLRLRCAPEPCAIRAKSSPCAATRFRRGIVAIEGRSAGDELGRRLELILDYICASRAAFFAYNYWSEEMS